MQKTEFLLLDTQKNVGLYFISIQVSLVKKVGKYLLADSGCPKNPVLHINNVILRIHPNFDITNDHVRPLLFTISRNSLHRDFVNNKGSWHLFTISRNSLHRDSLYRSLGVLLFYYLDSVVSNLNNIPTKL